MQYIKPEYKGRMIEQIMMNTDSSKLSEYEVDFKPAYICDKFMNISNS